jgi:hypothetical protein
MLINKNKELEEENAVLRSLLDQLKQSEHNSCSASSYMLSTPYMA